jgi:hypothetical protein
MGVRVQSHLVKQYMLNQITEPRSDGYEVSYIFGYDAYISVKLNPRLGGIYRFLLQARSVNQARNRQEINMW